MYIPNANREENLDKLAAFMRSNNFATLVSILDGAPFATHIPFIVTIENSVVTLTGYVAKANPQWRAFGAPWHTPFTYYAGVLNGTTRGGYSLPGLGGTADVLAGDRGLLIVSPIVLVAIGAAAWCVRHATGDVRRHAFVALAIVVPYLVLSAGWSGRT